MNWFGSSEEKGEIQCSTEQSRYLKLYLLVKQSTSVEIQRTKGKVERGRERGSIEEISNLV
jgi:hypothetical protein